MNAEAMRSAALEGVEAFCSQMKRERRYGPHRVVAIVDVEVPRPAEHFEQYTRPAVFQRTGRGYRRQLLGAYQATRLAGAGVDAPVDPAALLPASEAALAALDVAAADQRVIVSRVDLRLAWSRDEATRGRMTLEPMGGA